MKTSNTKNYFIIAIIFSIFLGFSMNDDDPKNGKNKNDAKSKFTKTKSKVSEETQHDGNGGVYETFGSPYYTDNFDGANDTNSLKARGYNVYYRGTGPQGITATWFQGNPSVFNSFNGPSSGYVAANYQVVNGANDIDSWLVLPKKNIISGDSLFFYSRSVSGGEYPDSIRIFYTPTGDSVPESPSWAEIGRFRVNNAGVWERRGFRAFASSPTGRFAIRYNVVNGGPSGANSDYIGIDQLTIERVPGPSDIGTLENGYWDGTSAMLPVLLSAPKATFKNFGLLNKTNIPVTFRITGPLNYFSTRVIPALSSGASVQVTFDSTFNPLPGVYNIAAYSSLVPDNNRFNDTVKSTITFIDPNSGNNGGYFFANSIAMNVPSRPEYCWADTTGSTTLIENGIVRDIPHFHGSIDDGIFRYSYDALDRRIRTFHDEKDSFFIGTNGIISFSNFDPQDNNWVPPLGGIPGGNVKDAVYPFWIDLNFGDPDVFTNRLSYKITQNDLIVTYDRAPLFNGGSTDYASFQIQIELVPLSLSSNSRIAVKYSGAASGNTGTGFINKYNNNGLASHLVGIQDQFGLNALTYRFSNSSVVTHGPLLDLSNGDLSVVMGPDPFQLNYSCTSQYPYVEFYQRDYNLGETIEIYSDWGEMELVFLGYNRMKYLNLSVFAPGLSTPWQIENVPLFSYSAVGTVQSQVFAFDIGIKGIPVTNIQYGLSITDDPLLAPPPITSSADVTPNDYHVFNGEYDTVTIAESPNIEDAVPLKGKEDAEIDTTTHKVTDFPNQESDKRACVPTGISNSLQFLRKKHSLTFDSSFASIGSIKKAVNWDSAGGTNSDTWPDLKKKYLEDNKIPITTRVKDSSYVSGIADELDNNQDIEMTIQITKNGKTWRHCVNVVGIKYLGNGKYQITVQDDRKQNQAGGTKTETVEYDSTTNTFTSGTYAALRVVKIKRFVIECPSPPKPAQQAPAQGAQNQSVQPTFSWYDYLQNNNPPPGTTFRVQIGTDENFGIPPTLDIFGWYGLSYTPPPGILNYNTQYFWRVRGYDSAGPGPWSDAWNFTTMATNTLNLKVLIQGLYNPVLNKMTKDSLKVYLRNESAPYSIVDSSKGLLDSTGSLACYFPGAVNGIKYYIVVQHRNSIETWSDSARSFSGGILNFDFTTSASNAFGNNETQVDASPLRFAIYSGDVNKDGVVDAADVSAIDNDAYNFATGYLNTDLTGDGVVDASDYAIGDNNAADFVTLVRP